jgi:tetratricopeptide (TPR) repeat protein
LSAYSGDFKHAVELDQLVLKLDPYNWPAWEELAQDKRLLEGPESELKTFQDMHIRASHAPFTRKARLIDFRLEYNLLHNHATEIRALLEDQETVLGGTEGTSSWYGLAMAELGRHGFASAQRYMDEADPNDPLLKEHLHDVQAGLHPATDAAAILHDREEADEAANEAYRNIIPDGPCGLAISYARLGRKQEALDTLARVQKQNAKVGCGGNAGIVLQYLGDPAGADTAFASAIAAAPSLPDAYEQRGEVRMMRQDWAGAAADFDIAHQKSPHWADPLKYGGDALVKLAMRWPPSARPLPLPAGTPRPSILPAPTPAQRSPANRNPTGPPAAKCCTAPSSLPCPACGTECQWPSGVPTPAHANIPTDRRRKQMSHLPRRALIVLAIAYAAPIAPSFARAAKKSAPPQPPADPMDGIDTDNDGSISLDEANVAAAAAFDSLDTTLDGKLDRTEMKSHMTPAVFREADTDKDKFLNKDEYMALVAKRFKAADADNDGTVDAAELKTAAGHALLILLK